VMKTQFNDSSSLTIEVVTCETCSILVPKENIKLHQARCTRVLEKQQQQHNIVDNSPAKQQQLHNIVDNSPAKQQQQQQQQQQQPTKKSKTKKKPNKTEKSKSEKKEEKEEDIDALLEEFTKLNNTCNYSTANSQRCTKSVRTLGQKCTFCAQVYCLTHHIAEAHGCGAAAKVKARQDIAKYADVKPRPMNGVKKAQVQRKLDKKLDELEGERKRKNKNK